jgi:Fic family protein
VPLPDLTNALTSPAIFDLLKAARESFVSAESIAAAAAAGVGSAEDVRAFLSAVLRPLSLFVTSTDGLEFRYFPTSRIQQYLRTLDVEASATSDLAQRVAGLPSAAVTARVLDAITSTRLDGIEIDFASARELLLLNRTPRSTPERIVANSFAVYSQLTAYAERDVGVDVLTDLYERLTQGVPGPENWLDSAASHPLHLHAATFPTPRAMLEFACETLCRELSNPGIHPAVPPMILLANIYSARPFPALNGMIARLAMQIYSIRSGYPVLGLAPYSVAVADWVAGRIGPEDGVPPESSLRATAHEPDITAWVTAWLLLAVRAVDRLRDEVESAETAHESYQDLLDIDPTLNPRQRLLLGHAVDKPDTTLRIASHKTTHDIAYSTARQDFLELEAKGYLVQGKEGRAFVYRVAPDFLRRLGSSTDD